MLDHVPVPTRGTFPAIVVPVTLQRFCTGPAFAIVGRAELVTVTVLVEGEQVPLEMLHWKTYTPDTIPVTVVLKALGLVMAGVFGPLIIVQVPVPTAGLFPARVVLFTLQRFCAEPAFATVGEA
jgi:hypothetical protein